MRRLRKTNTLLILALLGIILVSVLMMSGSNLGVVRTASEERPERGMQFLGGDVVAAAKVSSTDDRPIPSYLSVDFPDGTGIEYRLRPFPFVSKLPEGRIADHYDEFLKQAIAGDSRAAYRLHKALSFCEDSFSNSKQLQDALAEYQSTGEMHVPAQNGLATVVTSLDMRSLEIYYLEMIDRCSGLTADQVSAEEDWLYYAADIGNANAQFDLGQSLLTLGDPSAAIYLKAAWESGNLVAASHLWYFYSRNSNPKLNDPIQGYAYGYLYRQVRQGFLDLQSPSVDIVSARVDNEWRMTQAGNDLGPGEMEAAVELSKDLMPRNHTCCYSPEFR